MLRTACLTPSNVHWIFVCRDFYLYCLVICWWILHFAIDLYCAAKVLTSKIWSLFCKEKAKWHFMQPKEFHLHEYFVRWWISFATVQRLVFDQCFVVFAFDLHVHRQDRASVSLYATFGSDCSRTHISISATIIGSDFMCRNIYSIQCTSTDRPNERMNGESYAITFLSLSWQCLCECNKLFGL